MTPWAGPSVRQTTARYSLVSRRRFDLWSMRPGHARRDDETEDLRKFIACLQEVSDLVMASLDRSPEIFDYERAPEPFVDAISADLGNPFAFQLELAGKRAGARRGTPRQAGRWR